MRGTTITDNHLFHHDQPTSPARPPREERPRGISRSRPKREFSHIAAGMQHVYAICAGAFPEADAAIALVGDWVQMHTEESANNQKR